LALIQTMAAKRSLAAALIILRRPVSHLQSESGFANAANSIGCD
jgi:hypothetical protein